MKFIELYTCDVEQGVDCVFVFFDKGYVGMIDAVDKPINNDIKNRIIDHFEQCVSNVSESLNIDFGKFTISNKNGISIYFAPKYEYHNGLDELPYLYAGFEGVIENGCLVLDFKQKWFNQSLGKSEISTSSKSFTFKAI